MWVFSILLHSCGKEEKPSLMYFPPIGTNEWANASPASLGWNTDKVPDLMNLLETNGTRAFILLVDGKIVLEQYFGTDMFGSGPFVQSSNWYWASAAKTLTACLVGKAQEEGFLDLMDKSSDYLGTGWTSLTSQQEDLITVRHQLTMTAGLDDGVADNHSFLPQDLIYKADPGTRWAYHNAPYTLLDQVISNATGENFNNYFNSKLRDPIGMDGLWLWLDNDHVYFSTARSMARFGLLILNKGKWEQNEVLTDKSFLEDMVNTSQQLNKSYGYLWWLNGKQSFMLPELQIVFPGSPIPDGPTDMVSGMGKNGQYVSVIPSKKMVLIRLGENPESVPVPILFLNDIWKKLNPIINN
jgi:CubicO group peptidase (beta-lactamase class C family)